MNVNKVSTMDYENMSNWAICENEPNSNPIQTQSKLIQSQNKPNTNPILDGGRPSSVDCPFASGLTVQDLLVIVWPALSIAEWFDILDCAFSDLRQ